MRKREGRKKERKRGMFRRYKRYHRKHRVLRFQFGPSENPASED